MSSTLGSRRCRVDTLEPAKGRDSESKEQPIYPTALECPDSTPKALGSYRLTGRTPSRALVSRIKETRSARISFSVLVVSVTGLTHLVTFPSDSGPRAEVGTTHWSPSDTHRDPGSYSLSSSTLGGRRGPSFRLPTTVQKKSKKNKSRVSRVYLSSTSLSLRLTLPWALRSVRLLRRRTHDPTHCLRSHNWSLRLFVPCRTPHPPTEGGEEVPRPDPLSLGRSP